MTWFNILDFVYFGSLIVWHFSQFVCSTKSKLLISIKMDFKWVNKQDEQMRHQGKFIDHCVLVVCFVRSKRWRHSSQSALNIKHTLLLHNAHLLQIGWILMGVRAHWHLPFVSSYYCYIINYIVDQNHVSCILITSLWVYLIFISFVYSLFYN